MATNNTPPPSAGMNLGDIYYVLFKHKWMILALSLAGIAGAGYIYFRMPPPYESEAKLLVRYVSEEHEPLKVMNPGEIRQADSRGEGIIAAEAEILSSLDILEEVVDVIGTRRILGKNATTTNREYAAIVLRNNLIVDAPKKGNVMTVRFQNPDSSMVQPVLQQILDSYYKKHVKVHQMPGEFNDVLNQQVEQLRGQLANTEEDLRRLKQKAEIESLDTAKKAFAEERVKLREAARLAAVELKERQAALEALQGSKAGPDDLFDDEEVTSPETNKTAVASVTASQKPPKEKSDEYKRLNDTLDSFYREYEALRGQFTEESVLVKEKQAQIDRLVAQKKKMEEGTPGLVEEHEVATAKAGGAVLIDKNALIDGERVRVAALTAKVKELEAQSERLKGEATKMEDVGPKIQELERKKEMQEKQYSSASTSFYQAQLDALVIAGKISNIAPIQTPSPPFRDFKPLYKKSGIALGGGVGLGLGLAFLLELVLNQAVRKPGEILSQLRLPVFVSIPEFRNGRSRRRLLKNAERMEDEGVAAGMAQTNGTASTALVLKGSNKKVAPWDERHELHPFSEALRDRLVTYFEVKGMTHKPKLIAVTSCEHGAGVTSVAAGLAASLSETGEGNVLLVDMSMEQGAAHPFYKGKPSMGLEDVLLHDKRGEAKVNDKLYIVSAGEGADRLPRILPKRLTHLLPKLQASDYDYIIFDMPPVNQTSVTPRLAALMDMVLLMVEAGKTNRDAVRHASSLISETKANLGVVFNRRRNYVPQWLHQEY